MYLLGTKAKKKWLLRDSIQPGDRIGVENHLEEYLIV